MAEPVLLVEKQNGVAILTLNRPDQLNALSLELRMQLQEVLIKLRNDRDTGVVILTGAGRAFCAGLDLKEMGRTDQPPAGVELKDPARLFRELPQPVIGAINGLAVTGGLEISVSLDILLATPETQFADTHARVGLVPGWGLSARLSRWIGAARAKEMSLTGNFISAERALDWGLVNRIVPRERLLPTCISLAEDMLSCVPNAMLGAKRMIDRGFDLSLGDAMVYESEVSRLHQGPDGDSVEARRKDVQARGREQARRQSPNR